MIVKNTTMDQLDNPRALPLVVQYREWLEIIKGPALFKSIVFRTGKMEGSDGALVVKLPIRTIITPGHLRGKLILNMLHKLGKRITHHRLPTGTSFSTGTKGPMDGNRNSMVQLTHGRAANASISFSCCIARVFWMIFTPVSCCFHRLLAIGGVIYPPFFSEA